VAVLALGALLLTSCDWPQFRFGPEHSGYNATESTIGVGNVASLVQKWTAATGGAVHSSPAVVNGVVYVGSEDGKLYTFDATGGAVLWSATTGGPIDSSPAVANGVVYVGSSDGKLYAFDATGTTGCSGTPMTCTPLWTAQTGGAVGSSPAVANGVVYVSSDDNKLYAFDANGNVNCNGTPKTCAPMWTDVPPYAPIHSSPAVANGVVYLSSGGSGCFHFICFSLKALSAFDAAGTTGCSGTPATCSPLWTTQVIAGEGASSPAIANGVVYYGSAIHGVYGYDAATGAPVWSANSQGPVESSPAVANGKVYVGSNDGNLYAFDATSGTTVWTGATGGPVGSSPAVANGVVYVGSADHNLYAFDATSGVKLWSSATGGSVDSSPTVANGMVYVGSGDGGVYAFGLP
jgi:outer membrane protein assembly factor BamB